MKYWLVSEGDCGNRSQIPIDRDGEIQYSSLSMERIPKAIAAWPAARRQANVRMCVSTSLSQNEWILPIARGGRGLDKGDNDI